MRTVILWAFLVLFGFGGAVLGLAHCTALKEDTAEATYSGQQAECVAEAQSLAQSKKCRAEVDARWGRVDSGALPLDRTDPWAEGGTDGH
jgi:hypothetical protein